MPQPRMLEALKIVGVLDDYLAHAVSDSTVQAYKLPGGTEKLPVHEMFARQEPTAAIPYVSTFYRIQARVLMLLLVWS
jgi:hypothetical protein